MYYKYRKEDTKRAWPCGRAASGRVAWQDALKKCAPKSAGKTCCRPAFTAAADKVCTRTKKKGTKKGKKEASAGQNPRLSRSVRYRRPGSGGGVFQPGGWLGCTLYAGSITEAAGAASETGWAALYTHFLPAELPEGVRLVYALFTELCQPCMHTFCKEPGAA